jgi:hypothetical protein
VKLFGKRFGFLKNTTAPERLNWENSTKSLNFAWRHLTAENMQTPQIRDRAFNAKQRIAGNSAHEPLHSNTDADLDLDEIWEYIAADSIDNADHWIAKLFDAFE